MQELGWIKLHRKLRENPIYKNANLSRIFIELIFIANHKGAQIMWNGKMRNIDAGQCITGRFSMSKILAIKPTTIYSSWQKLKKMGFIDIESDNRNSLITILKYKQYQLLINDNDNSFDNKMTTNRQQNDTNNNNKNNKNTSKEVGEEKTSPTPSEKAKTFFELEEFRESIIPLVVEKKKLPEDFVRREINRFLVYWTELTKSGNKQKWQLQQTFEVDKRLNTWLNKAIEYNQKENKSQQKGFVSL